MFKQYPHDRETEQLFRFHALGGAIEVYSGHHIGDGGRWVHVRTAELRRGTSEETLAAFSRGVRAAGGRVIEVETLWRDLYYAMPLEGSQWGWSVDVYDAYPYEDLVRFQAATGRAEKFNDKTDQWEWLGSFAPGEEFVRVCRETPLEPPPGCRFLKIDREWDQVLFAIAREPVTETVTLGPLCLEREPWE